MTFKVYLYSNNEAMQKFILGEPNAINLELKLDGCCKITPRNCYSTCLLQEEGDVLCLPGGSDAKGQHCDEGRG